MVNHLDRPESRRIPMHNGKKSDPCHPVAS